jgi:hypothetical protein
LFLEGYRNCKHILWREYRDSFYVEAQLVQPWYLEITVQEKLCSGWAGPFKLTGVVISHLFVFSAADSQVQLKAFFLVHSS